MNVKSMIVGFLNAVVASTGTYFLVPPPRDAVAGFFISRDEMWNILEACEIQITNQGELGQIFCYTANYKNRH